MLDYIYPAACASLVLLPWDKLTSTRLRRAGCIVAALLAWQAFQYFGAIGNADYVRFSNDGPLGMMKYEDQHVEHAVGGFWDDSQYIGGKLVGLEAPSSALRLIQPHHVNVLTYLLPLEFWMCVAAWIWGNLKQVFNTIWITNSVLVLICLVACFVFEFGTGYPYGVSENLPNNMYLIGTCWIHISLFVVLAKCIED